MKIDQTKTRVGDLNTRPKFVHRTSSFNEKNRTEVVYLPTEKLKPFRYQGRKIFSEEELQQLAETIREHGIRQPLTVLRTEETETVFEVVSGERRLRAAKIVGLTSVPCIVIDDLAKAEEIALVENIQRKDLHPVELARSLKSLLEARGWGGQTALSKKLGISTSQISELLSLMELPVELQDFILSSNFRGRENFRKLLSLKNDVQQRTFIESLTSPVQEKNKNPQLRNQSVLRVSITEEGFKVQKTKLNVLTKEQKERMLSLLYGLIEEIES